MIVFTITNTLTEQVYVGTTRDTIDTRWQQILAATESGLESRLYSDIREHGAVHFDIAEWAEAEDLQELRALTQDAIDTYQAINLQGLRTKEPIPQQSKRQSTISPRSDSREIPTPGTDHRPAPAALTSHPVAVNPALEPAAELPTGRVTSAAQEKKIREAINREQDARITEKTAKEKAAAAEMAMIMARIDARAKKPKAATSRARSSSAASTASTAGRNLRSVQQSRTDSAPSTLKIADGRVASSSKEKQIRDAIAREKDARISDKIAQQRAEAAEMAQIMARIDARAKAPKKATKKPVPRALKSSAVPDTRLAASAATLPSSPRASQSVSSSRGQVKSAASNALLDKPKLATGRLASSGKEKQLREAIAKEKAERQAKKLSQQAAEAAEMAAIIARLDNRAKTVKRR